MALSCSPPLGTSLASARTSHHQNNKHSVEQQEEENKTSTVGWNIVPMKAFVAVTSLVLCVVGTVEALAPPRPQRISVTTSRSRLPPFFQRRTEDPSSRRSTSENRPVTELGMGFRSILGKVKNRKNRDDGDDNDASNEYKSYDNDPPEPPSFAQQPTTAPPVSQIPQKPPPAQREVIIPTTIIEDDVTKKPPLRMGEDPNSKEINVNLLDQNESVQERINRVKAGKMTQEEKEAYLKAALSTGNSPETRLPLRPPAAVNEVDDKRARASPFPEDPILRSIAGGKDPAPAILSKQLVDKSGVDSQKKKREYLDMVTDPHRFDVFRSQPARARLNPSSPAQGNISGYQGTVDQNNNGQEYDYNVPSNGNQSSVPSMSAPPQPTPDFDSSVLDDTAEGDGFPSTDLAGRLEAAAHAQEQQREQQRKQQEEQKMLKKQQEEEEQRAKAAKAAEEERRRQEILAQREKEYRERRRREEEAAARESAKAKEAEEQRLKALLDAQEDFWKQKLAKERELRERRLMEEQQEPAARQEPAPAPPPVVNLPPPKPSPSLGQNNLSKHVFNPDERNILDEDGEEEKPSEQEANSGPPRPSINSYLNDVANNRLTPPKKIPGRRFQKGEEEMDEQLRRLKELNSPLPNIPATSRYDSRKRSPPAAFKPQRPASAYSPPKPTTSMTNGAVNGSSPTNGASAPPRPKPAASPPPPSAPRAAAPAPANPLNALFNQPAPSPAPAPKVASPPERKGPIRMQIPLDEDNSFDEEEGIDATSNKKMSIADAMRKSGTSGGMDQEERSKKWYVTSKVWNSNRRIQRHKTYTNFFVSKCRGVDMSKFM